MFSAGKARVNRPATRRQFESSVHRRGPPDPPVVAAPLPTPATGNTGCRPASSTDSNGVGSRAVPSLPSPTATCMIWCGATPMWRNCCAPLEPSSSAPKMSFPRAGPGTLEQRVESCGARLPRGCRFRGALHRGHGTAPRRASLRYLHGNARAPCGFGRAPSRADREALSITGKCARVCEGIGCKRHSAARRMRAGRGNATGGDPGSAGVARSQASVAVLQPLDHRAQLSSRIPGSGLLLALVPRSCGTFAAALSYSARSVKSRAGADHADGALEPQLNDY